TRAHQVLSTLLCDPLAGPAVVDPTVADVSENPACAGRHTVLDPVASAFYGFANYFVPGEVAGDYVAGCHSGSQCYPLPAWDAADVDDRDAAGMPPPALSGVPAVDLTQLGAAIADDPRFAPCTVRRFLGYLTQTPLQEVADADVDRFVPDF